ncbi:MAG: hypothetical protein J6Q64_00955, partial [Clostridia bacterium]|nr:hypothetical protein [Clostridia bacterium]
TLILLYLFPRTLSMDFSLFFQKKYRGISFVELLKFLSRFFFGNRRRKEKARKKKRRIGDFALCGGRGGLRALHRASF